jgi:hypothetical protein
MFHPNQEKDDSTHEEGKKPAEMIIRAQNENGEPITAVVDSTGLTTTTTERSVHRGKMEEGEKKVSQIAHFS